MRGFAEYVKVTKDYKVPETMQAVTLSGLGEECLRLGTLKVPECGDNQMLARVDAVTACASDNKLIDQGPEHPLMYQWDVSKYPIVLGHEGSVTIVRTGRNLKKKYPIGQRFAIQPAAPASPRHNRERYRNEAEGINKIAVGYTLPGLFSEYVLISEELIDTGCILPFPSEKIPYFGGALAEPISDVIAAQERIVHILKETPSAPRRARIGPMKDGVTLIIGSGPMGLMHIEVAMSHGPRKIIVSELIETRRRRAKEIFEGKATHQGIKMVFTDPNNLREVLERETQGKGADDVIVALGIAKIQEESFSYLAPNGVTVFFGGTPHRDRMIQIDTHRIHYDGVTAVGSSGSDPSDIAKVLEMIADDSINPGNYVVKCGGLDAAIPLIRTVRNQAIEGKGVIYPHARSALFDIHDWDSQKERDFLEEKIVNH